MQTLASWLRPSALTGLTFGLKYIGTVTDGNRISRIYSNLKSTAISDTRIDFEGGAYVGDDGGIGSGRKHGKIVALWRDKSGQHFFSHLF